MRGLRASILPAVAALAAMFIVLPTTGADAEVRIIPAAGSWRLEPAALTVEPGDRVAFTNESGATHTATCLGCPWATGDVQPGQTVMIEMPDEGAFTYSCRYHPDRLTGTLQVGDAEATPSLSPSESPGPIAS